MTLSERVTEKQLNTLAAKLGAEWEGLAIDLGLKGADVDTCKENNPFNVRSRKFAMLMKWRAKAGKDATVTKLVQKLRAFEPEIDEEKFNFLLPPEQQTVCPEETGLAKALIPAVPEQTPQTSVDPSLIQLWKQASAIVQKTNPGVNFTPDGRGGKKEEERVQKIKEWEAPLKKRVENFSSSINYSIDYEGFSAINESMKSVCLIEYPTDSGTGTGTGFLISPRHVVTANHVLVGANESYGQVTTDPSRFLAHFHISGTKRLTFTFKPSLDLVVAHDENLDYAIVEIHSPEPDDQSTVSEELQRENICPLGTKIGLGMGEGIVVVVGHPNGTKKRVDFCPVVNVDDVKNQAITLLGVPDTPQWPEANPTMGSYQTSVMFEGSSGSPGFSKHGNVVLMHLQGFRPYSNQPSFSIVEMGVLLSGVKEDARAKLSSDVFSEIFGS